MKVAALALAFASTALGQSLQEVLAANNATLSSLAGLLQTPGVSLPSNLTNITLLAPSNSAIGAFLNSSAAAGLASNPGLISAVLQYHILQGNYSNITGTSFIPTYLGAQDQTYSQVTGGQRVQSARSSSNVTFISGLLQSSSVTSNATIPFSGGSVHVIDKLLTIPQNISSTAVAFNLTSAAGALGALNLTETVDTTPDVTIFVPNNAAFQAIGSVLNSSNASTLTSVLSYHVVAGTVLYSTDIVNGSSIATYQGANITVRQIGSDVYVNNAKVLVPNVLVSNGVVHVIDRVLNPGNSTVLPNASATEQAFAGAASASDVPFTSGVPTPTTSINVASATSRAASATGASSSGAAFRPLQTGAVGVAALFGGAAAFMNL